VDKKPKPVKVGKASVVACDLDGVIGDIVQQLLLFSHRKHGLSLAAADIVSENFDMCTPIRRDQLQKFFETDEFFRSLPVLPGSREALLRLRAAGCEIHIVTDRFWYREIDRDTTDWLTRNEIPFDSVIFARKVEKPHFAAQLSANWFIEDRLSNALLLSPVCRVLLVDRPYNQGSTPESVMRVHDISRAAEVITDTLNNSTGRKRISRSRQGTRAYGSLV
jgi:uncharacterized HAD superfamily protein